MWVVGWVEVVVGSTQLCVWLKLGCDNLQIPVLTASRSVGRSDTLKEQFSNKNVNSDTLHLQTENRQTNEPLIGETLGLETEQDKTPKRGGGRT